MPKKSQERRTIRDYTDHELLNTPVAQELIGRNYRIIHRSILKVLMKSKTKENQFKNKRRNFDHAEFE